MEVPALDNQDEPRTLLSVTSQPGYASRVSEIVQSIPNAVDEAAAVRLLTEAAHCLGADVAAFASFTRDDGSHESYRFLLACDASWCHEYERGCCIFGWKNDTYHPSEPSKSC